MPLSAALLERLKAKGVKSVVGEAEDSWECPNTWNKYHSCSDWCKTNWKTVDQKQLLIEEIFDKIPSCWRLVPDDESGSCYFWNTNTNVVQWRCPVILDKESGLPTPAPPKTALLDSPSNPRDSYDTSDESRGKPRDNDVARDESRSKSRDIDAMRGGPRDRTRARSPPPDIQMPSVDDIQMPPPPSQNRKETKRESKRYKPKQEDEVDPMDPASYSDAPRGDWHRGLPKTGDAKTGVDVTANGPLFQQRPYPAPGDILRMNAAAKNAAAKKDEEEGEDV